MRELRALNASWTAVGAKAVEALTYGLRLRRWRLDAEAAEAAAERIREDAKNASPLWWEDGGGRRKRRRAAEVGGGASTAPPPAAESEQQWPLSKLVYLRMQGTPVTAEAIQHLTALQELRLLDVRQTAVKVPTAHRLQVTFGLVKQPNEGKLLASTNTLLAGALRGQCGCAALEAAPGGARAQAKGPAAEERTAWFEAWEDAYTKLLLQRLSTPGRS